MNRKDTGSKNVPPLADHYFRFMSLPEEERRATLAFPETDDSRYARACRGFDELIAAALAALNGYVANQIAFSKWVVTSPDSSPEDQLWAITSVCGGLHGKGEWDRVVVDGGGLPYLSVWEIPLRLYQYLETLPFKAEQLISIRNRISEYGSLIVRNRKD